MIWTITLLGLIVADAILTTYIGSELNSLILWVMRVFSISLGQAMILKVIWSIPWVYLVHKSGYSKLTVLIYAGLYVSLTGVFNY